MLAALGAVLASCGGKSGGKPNFADNEYAVRTVATEGTELQTTYPATIKGIQDVQIRPKVSGFITKICVHEGQTVSAGQLLFVIDNETYQAQVRQAKAAVNTAKAQLATSNHLGDPRHHRQRRHQAREKGPQRRFFQQGHG